MTAEGDDLPRRKDRLRREVAARLRSLGPEELAGRGRRAVERLKSTPDFRSARSCLLYASLPDEIDTATLIDELLAGGKKVFLPTCHQTKDEMRAVRIADRGRDLIEGRFGILEPRPELEAAGAEEVDFILAPGRAFDRQCRRLGRGRGFYDRFLHTALEGGGLAAAVALDIQIFDQLPTGKRDLPVHLVATESELIRPGGGSRAPNPEPQTP